uniref:G domain-containing protein n=1 Tax=Mola mola TaxID=94237 RepID=A0A3Q3XIV3_MOLML
MSFLVVLQDLIRSIFTMFLNLHMTFPTNQILIYGPAGAGKSSFINSVQALTSNNSTRNSKWQQLLLPFVFVDTTGVEMSQDMHMDDIKLALRGHVPEGYTFKADSKLSDDSRLYVRSPTENNKVHALLCVYPTDTMSQLKEKHRDKQQLWLCSPAGIPQAAILTKIDQACPELRRNLQNVYKVPYLRNKVCFMFSKEVGIPMDCIFPVKNYHEEIDLDNDIDMLILSTLKNVIDLGEDYIQKFHH